MYVVETLYSAELVPDFFPSLVPNTGMAPEHIGRVYLLLDIEQPLVVVAPEHFLVVIFEIGVLKSVFVS